MSQNRRMFDSTKKADVVQRQLKDGVPVSDVARELDVQPSQIHQCVSQILSQAEKAFENPGKSKRRSVAAIVAAPGRRRSTRWALVAGYSGATLTTLANTLGLSPRGQRARPDEPSGRRLLDVRRGVLLVVFRLLEVLLLNLVSQSVAAAGDLDDLGVMQEAIEDRGRRRTEITADILVGTC